MVVCAHTVSVSLPHLLISVTLFSKERHHRSVALRRGQLTRRLTVLTYNKQTDSKHTHTHICYQKDSLS